MKFWGIAGVIALFVSLELVSSAQTDYACRWVCKLIPRAENSLVEFGRGQLPALKRSNVKMLVWNTQKATQSAWKGDFQERVAETDLVLLQEVVKREGEPLFNALDDPRLTDWFWALGVSFITNDDRQTGVVIGSVSTPLKSQFFRSIDSEPLTSTPKSILVSEFRVEGMIDPLLVINIHALNFSGPDFLLAQLKQVAPLLEETKGPVVFAGDFNTWSIGRRRVMEQFMRKWNLDQVSLGFSGHSLDHVFVRDVRQSYGFVEDVHSSDHDPIWVKLNL